MSNTTKIVRETKRLKADTVRRNRIIAALAARGTDWLLDEIGRTQKAITPIITGRCSVEIMYSGGGISGWSSEYDYCAIAKKHSETTAQGSFRATPRSALASLLFVMRVHAKRHGIKIPRRR